MGGEGEGVGGEGANKVHCVHISRMLLYDALLTHTHTYTHTNTMSIGLLTHIM